MPDNVVNPLSNEPIVDGNGYPTRRFFAWLRDSGIITNDINQVVQVSQVDIAQNTTVNNLTTVSTDLDLISSVHGEAQQNHTIAATNKKTEAEQGLSLLGIIKRLEDRINQLEMERI